MHAIFVLAMLFTTGAPAMLDRLNTSIEQFYNTSEPIWTYRTRADSRSNISCLVDVAVNTTLTYLYFDRSSYLNKTRLKKALKMYLYNGRTGNTSRTLVYEAEPPIYEQKNPLFEEQLLYQSGDSSCGVFRYFKHPNVNRYDLRVRNCSLATGPDTDCWLYFNKTADFRISKYERLKERKVYDSKCQAILWTTDGCQ
uniref:Putative lipocalin-3 1 n=1 Tax=Amblyomma cajennense TaxID=34607 RepID=A0A023FRY1_AMBCJ